MDVRLTRYEKIDFLGEGQVRIKFLHNFSDLQQFYYSLRQFTRLVIQKLKQLLQ